MTTVTKFDIFKFDEKMSFNIWKVQMMAILTHSGINKAIGGNRRNLLHESMTDKQLEELDEKTLSMI